MRTGAQWRLSVLAGPAPKPDGLRLHLLEIRAVLIASGSILHATLRHGTMEWRLVVLFGRGASNAAIAGPAVLHLLLSVCVCVCVLFF